MALDRPSVRILGDGSVKARPGSTVTLTGHTSDPDRNRVATGWWQYQEEGSYPGTVTLTGDGDRVTVAVPADATPGQTVSIIFQGTDNGRFPLTRYDRVTIRIV